MLKTFHVNYKTENGDSVLIETREGMDSPIVMAEMKSDSEGNCEYESSVSGFFEYRYAVKMRDGMIEERHWRYSPSVKGDVEVFDTWRSPESGEDALAASAFSSAVFLPDEEATPKATKQGSLIVVLTEPRVGKDEEIRVVSKQFVNWNTERAMKMQHCKGFTWVLDLGAMPILKEFEFKFCIWDTKNDCFKRYEEGENHLI